MNRTITRVVAVAAVALWLTPQLAWAAGEAKKQPEAKPQTEATTMKPATPTGNKPPAKPLTEEEKLAKKAADAKKPLLKPYFNDMGDDVPKVTLNLKALRRYDFRIVGKTCAVCLLGIQRRLRKTPGVAKVAIMLKKPYGAVVIYDSTKLNQAALDKKIKEGEKEVKIEGAVDAAVERIPPVLIPKYHNLNGIDDTALPVTPPANTD